MVDVHRAVLACRVCVDTSLIVSEASNNLEGNRNRASHEKMVAEILFTQRYVIGTANNTNALLETCKLALLINCSVGVEIFGNETTCVLNVLKSMRWETTFTTMIIKSSSAINKLLLTEVSELTVLFHEVRLHATNCGESPAATALSLVLNRSNHTIVSPIPMCRYILNWNFKRDSFLCILVSS